MTTVFFASSLLAIALGFMLGRDGYRFSRTILPLSIVLAAAVPAVPLIENTLRDHRAASRFREEPQVVSFDGALVEGVHSPDRKTVTFTFPDGKWYTIGPPAPWYSEPIHWHDVKAGAIFGGLSAASGLLAFGVGQVRASRAR